MDGNAIKLPPPRDWADTTTELVRGSMFSTIYHKFVVWFWLGGCAFAALQQISLTPHVLQVIAAGDGIMHVPGCTQVPVAKPSGCLRTRTLFFLCMRLSDWSEDLRLRDCSADVSHGLNTAHRPNTSCGPNTAHGTNTARGPNTAQGLNAAHAPA